MRQTNSSSPSSSGLLSKNNGSRSIIPEMKNQLYSPDKIAHNERIVYHTRVFTGIMFGIMTGVLGLTGIYGFLVYVVSSLFCSVSLILTLPKFSVSGTFQDWSSIWQGGAIQGLLTFILFWTLAYDFVYIFF